MSLPNLPVMIFTYVALVAGFYGFLAAGLWAAGRLAGSARAMQLGAELARGTAGVYLGYAMLLTAMVFLLVKDVRLGLWFALAQVLAPPAMVFLPPNWSGIRSVVADA